MIEIAGVITLGLLGLCLAAAYPLSELARAMASDRDAHPRSRGAMVASLAGVALLVALVKDCAG